jgi:hypothetical protein
MPREAGTKKRGGCPWVLVSVGDVPGAPSAVLALVLQLAGVDCFQALGAAVAFPPVAVDVVAVAGVPDQVCFVDGHLSVSVVDLFILQGQRGIWQLPGDTWLIATHWAVWRTLICSAACWALVSTWAPAARVRPASRA